MRKCEKCGLEDGGTLINDRIRREVDRCSMAGGYYAYLCLPCCNASTEHIEPKTVAMGKLIGRYKAHIAIGESDAAAEVAAKMHAENDRLLAISKAWVNSVQG